MIRDKLGSVVRVVVRIASATADRLQVGAVSLPALELEHRRLSWYDSYAGKARYFDQPMPEFHLDPTLNPYGRL